jgi:hypothetical protein
MGGRENRPPGHPPRFPRGPDRTETPRGRCRPGGNGQRIAAAEGEWLFPHAYQTGPWLWGRPGHRPLDEVKQLGERAGVAGLTILAEDWGIGELMLQRILRHSTPRTQKHYRHHDAELLHRAAAKVRFG